MNKFLHDQLPGQLHGAVKTQAVTVTSTAALIPSEALSARKDIIIQNTSETDSIFIGGSDVTVSSGIEVEPGGVFSIQLGRASLYAISSVASVAGVRVMELA